MASERTFQCSNTQFEDLVPALTAWFDQGKFKTQVITTQEGQTMLQVCKGGWRNLIGMSAALNVILDHEETAVKVNIAAGRWLDKATVGTVSLFVLWPLMVTAGFGAWKQMRMPKKVYGSIEQILESL